MAAVILWFFWGGDLVPDAGGTRLEIYGGVGTLAGLALAASTFACTMTYQSSNSLLTTMRETYHDELKRNWTSIILSSLACAVLPVLAMALDEHQPHLAFSMVTYALVLLVLRFGRSVWWLRLSLFIIDKSDLVTQAEAPPLRSRSSRETRD
ncbi:hypothetical protein PQI66_08010 [Corynebacterium sp. USCH3]|uniref:hypothetical protein n=1 Tax=Corynebacterium sp. USCH3 TaxID=3024840 RepID=UPI0030B10143